MTHRLIGLYSPAPQSGKSTVAEYLCRVHGYQQIAFAGPLKEMTDKFLECLGLEESLRVRMVYGDLKETLIGELGCTPRHLMQTLGTEWGRNCVHVDVWAKLTIARAAAARRPVAVDDLRFPNEHKAIVEAGGICVRVTRPSAKRTTTHASEGALDNAAFDFEIVNDGSIDHLYSQVDALVMP